MRVECTGNKVVNILVHLSQQFLSYPIFVLGQNMAAKICLVGHFLAAIFCPTPPKLVLGNHSLSTFRQLIGMLELIGMLAHAPCD